MDGRHFQDRQIGITMFEMEKKKEKKVKTYKIWEVTRGHTGLFILPTGKASIVVELMRSSQQSAFFFFYCRLSAMITAELTGLEVLVTQPLNKAAWLSAVLGYEMKSSNK